MNIIVKDPSINCVMSENGKHWLLTTYEKPEHERTCKNVYDEMKMGACDNGFECSECGEKVEDREGYHVKGTWNYCPGCRAKVVG